MHNQWIVPYTILTLCGLEIQISHQRSTSLTLDPVAVVPMQTYIIFFSIMKRQFK